MAEKNSSDIERGDGIFEALAGDPIAGVSVNQRSAMSVSAVYACVGLISGAISALPLSLYRRTDQGRERIDGDDIWWMLNHDPTPRFSGAAFWEFMLSSVLLGGDGFAEIKRKRSGLITGFEPIHPSDVEPRKKGDRLVYVITPEEGQRYAVDQDDMIHIPGLGFDGKRSLSPVQHAARAAIGTAIAATEYNAEFFANGARPDFLITTSGRLSEEDREEIRKGWMKRYMGSGNRHKPMVAGGGLDVKPLTMSVADAQAIDVLKWQVVDIARAYGVPPHMIAETGESTTWGTGIEQLTLGFLKFTLRPHINRIERELNRKLFGRSDRYLEYSVEGLLRGDSKAQAEYFAKALGGPGSQGWMLINEVRRLQNLPPLDNGDQLILSGANKSNDQKT